jgi:hypothetical protein
MLPGDFAGPPASAVSGNVVAAVGAGTKDAVRPRLSIEWLAGHLPYPDTPSLIGQPVSYQRSSKLQNDWEIGLQLPTEAAKFVARVGGDSQVRLSVGKMVYYDDRTEDGHLDWSCRGARCDIVKAVSAEFVVFVESPLHCQPHEGGPLRARVPAGYHYFRYEEGVIAELGDRDAMSFVLTDRSLAESDPTAALRAFTQALLRSWSVSTLEGC